MAKIKGLTKKEATAIAEYERLLLARFPRRISRMMLFGSKARGTSNRNSDVDILVVLTRNGKKATREIVGLTFEPIAKYMVDISPIVVEEKFFKDWSPLLEHIKKDGIVLWARKTRKKSMPN
jgi:predicted nucleotidyltransferase